MKASQSRSVQNVLRKDCSPLEGKSSTLVPVTESNDSDMDEKKETDAWLGTLQGGKPKKGWGKTWSANTGSKASTKSSQTVGSLVTCSKDPAKKVQFRSIISFVDPSPVSATTPASNSSLDDFSMPLTIWPANYGSAELIEPAPSPRVSKPKDISRRIKVAELAGISDQTVNSKLNNLESPKMYQPQAAPRSQLGKLAVVGKVAGKPASIRNIPSPLSPTGSIRKRLSVDKVTSPASPSGSVRKPANGSGGGMPSSINSPTVLSVSTGWNPESARSTPKVWSGRIYRNRANGTKVILNPIAAVNGSDRDLIALHHAVKCVPSFDFTYRVPLEELRTQFRGKKLVVCLEIAPRGPADEASFHEYGEYYRTRQRAGVAVIAEKELLYLVPLSLALQLTRLDPKILTGIGACMESKPGVRLIGLWAPSRQKKT